VFLFDRQTVIFYHCAIEAGGFYMLGYFGDLGEMRYDDVIDVFKQKAKKWNLPEPDEDVLLLNIKRWERQKAKKNPNIKQNILDYKHHEELYEAMRNYRTKEEEELEKQTKILKYTIITQFDNYKLIKVLDPITLAEFTKYTNLCVQNVEIAKRYFEDYYHFYLLTKDNMVCFIISSKGKNGAPINIATRTDVGIAKGNTYNYSDLYGMVRTVLEIKNIDALEYSLRIIENIENTKYEIDLGNISLIYDKYTYYKDTISALISKIITSKIKIMNYDSTALTFIMYKIKDSIIVFANIFTPKEDIAEYIDVVKQFIISTSGILKDLNKDNMRISLTLLFLDIFETYRKYFMRNLLSIDEIYDLGDEEIMYGYVVRIAKSRIPKFEPYIVKNPRLAYSYSKEIIKGRWKEAEPYIMQSPDYILLYAMNIIRGRWKEAEPYIMQNPKYAFFYARDIIKGRWKEAEPYIMKDPEIASKYEEFVY
jgi:hypothetical protein